MNINGASLCFASTAQSVEGIAIDPYEMFIFYTDGGANTINLVTYDGKKHLRIVMNAKNPRAIETDRKNKYEPLFSTSLFLINYFFLKAVLDPMNTTYEMMVIHWMGVCPTSCVFYQALSVVFNDMPDIIT